MIEDDLLSLHQNIMLLAAKEELQDIFFDQRIHGDPAASEDIDLALCIPAMNVKMMLSSGLG
jgi:hypothetical protein